MRIISGIYKGRKLSPAKKANIRPTTDRVRETMFNILNNRIDFSEGEFLDLFCGTGSFGIECISRGAAKVVFVDKNVDLVKKNIDLLGINNISSVIKKDAISYLDNSGDHFDAVFADPPYGYGQYEELMDKAEEVSGLFILEHSSRDKFEKAELRKDFGDTSLSFFNFGNNHKE